LKAKLDLESFELKQSKKYKPKIQIQKEEAKEEV